MLRQDDHYLRLSDYSEFTIATDPMAQRHMLRIEMSPSLDIPAEYEMSINGMPFAHITSQGIRRWETRTGVAQEKAKLSKTYDISQFAYNSALFRFKPIKGFPGHVPFDLKLSIDEISAKQW